MNFVLLNFRNFANRSRESLLDNVKEVLKFCVSSSRSIVGEKLDEGEVAVETRRKISTEVFEVQWNNSVNFLLNFGIHF